MDVYHPVTLLVESHFRSREWIARCTHVYLQMAIHVSSFCRHRPVGGVIFLTFGHWHARLSESDRCVSAVICLSEKISQNQICSISGLKFALLGGWPI